MKGPILEITWMDKKAVYAAGTYTQARQENLPELNRKQKDGTLQRITCLQLISSFNTYMGGVDKNDQMKSYYTIPVSGKKWWSRILFNLVNRSIFYNFVLEQESPNHAERTLKSFRIDLAKRLIGDFSSQRKSGRPSVEPRDPLLGCALPLKIHNLSWASVSLSSLVFVLPPLSSFLSSIKELRLQQNQAWAIKTKFLKNSLGTQCIF